MTGGSWNTVVTAIVLIRFRFRTNDAFPTAEAPRPEASCRQQREDGAIGRAPGLFGNFITIRIVSIKPSIGLDLSNRVALGSLSIENIE